METASLAIPTPTLANVLWPRSSALRAAILALSGSLLLAVSAKIQVPFWPVPMTMQSLAVLLIGITLGSRMGAATIVLYLAEGFCGLPVFAGATAGPAYMAGPTGGYLIGFLLCAAAVGVLAERGWDRNPLRATVAFGVGHMILFVPGVLWLAVLFGWTKAIAVGVTPFLAATIIKTALGVAVMAAVWKIAGKHRSTMPPV